MTGRKSTHETKKQIADRFARQQARWLEDANRAIDNVLKYEPSWDRGTLMYHCREKGTVWMNDLAQKLSDVAVARSFFFTI